MSALERTSAILRLLRVRTALPGVFAALLGAEVMAPAGTPSPARVGAAVLVSLLVATATNLHNATTDVAEDGLNQPARLGVLRAAGARAAWTLASGGILACGLLLASLGPLAAGLAVLAAVGMHQYSGWPVRAKGRPFLGTVVFAGSLVVPLWAGMLAAGPGWDVVVPRPEAATVQRVAAWTLALGATWVAKAFIKNLPDRAGDAAAGLWTTATIAQPRARRECMFAAWYGPSFLFVPFVAGAAGAAVPPSWPALLLLAVVGAGCSGASVVRAATPGAANEALARDMAVSTAVIAVVYCLVGGSVGTAATVSVLALFLRHPLFDARLESAATTVGSRARGER